MESPVYTDFLASSVALEQFLGAFYAGTLPKYEWTHAAHIALAAYLLYEADMVTVLPRVRASIRSYNLAVGGQNAESAGYHETLTVFWLRVVAAHLKPLRSPTRLHAVRAAVAALGEARNLHSLYYSTNVVANSLARRQWIEPDLQPLPEDTVFQAAIL